MNGFKAEFSHFQLVKTRKIAQFVFELPFEEADRALAVLGGTSAIGSQWVAVAPLTEEAAQRGPTAPRKPKSRAEMAGIYCNDPRFWQYLSCRGFRCEHAEHAALAVRTICHVASRAELNTNPAAAARWEELANGFKAYTGQSGEPER